MLLTKEITFKDGLYIDVPNDTYYLDENWQHIVIKNGRIVCRVYNSDPMNEPNLIFTNEFTDTYIFHYMTDCKTSKKSLTYSAPLMYWQETSNFVDILLNSRYNISKPYKFDVVNGNIVRLIEGTITR